MATKSAKSYPKDTGMKPVARPGLGPKKPHPTGKQMAEAVMEDARPRWPRVKKS